MYYFCLEFFNVVLDAKCFRLKPLENKIERNEKIMFLRVTSCNWILIPIQRKFTYFPTSSLDHPFVKSVFP